MVMYIAPIAAAIALVVAFCLSSWITKADEGNDRMREISGYIREGAMAFLKREYKSMAIVIAILFVLIGFGLKSWTTAILYVIGALLSVLAGYFGMNVATKGNVRTAAAAMDHGMPKALKIAFRSGAVMGLCVSGLGLFGLGVVVCVLDLATDEINKKSDLKVKYENVKKGRKIIGFTFTVHEKPKAKTDVVSKERDASTADMFTVDGLNDKQLGRIARNPAFMAEYNHLVSPTSLAGQSQQGWEFEMINRLKKDPTQFNKRPIKEYLEY